MARAAMPRAAAAAIPALLAPDAAKVVARSIVFLWLQWDLDLSSFGQICRNRVSFEFLRPPGLPTSDLRILEPGTPGGRITRALIMVKSSQSRAGDAGSHPQQRAKFTSDSDHAIPVLI